MVQNKMHHELIVFDIAIKKTDRKKRQGEDDEVNYLLRPLPRVETHLRFAYLLKLSKKI
jgi:hypothetical protein